MSTYFSPPTHKRVTALGAAASLALVLGGSAIPAFADDADTTDSTVGTELYRPGYHYSPAKNWVNDPNGMVYYNGTYHLFYQHNPYGNGWGNMSWGHATSTDLMNWEEQPIAIRQGFAEDGTTAIEDIFSGSVVVDENNSSGFGKDGETPLVAIYTSAYTGAHPTLAGKQAQSLASSLDDGETWTKYSGNPVVNRNSSNFRDPKVFWYDDDTSENGGYWVMVAVEATDYKVVLYKSADLKAWEHMSDFGPANAVGGIWECPDLFPVKADDGTTKWVMVVNLNPGSVAGGSGGQYFVGDFNGTTFTADDASIVTDSELPGVSGNLISEDYAFESDTYGSGWTIENLQGAPFGSGPVKATACAASGRAPISRARSA